MTLPDRREDGLRSYVLGADAKRLHIAHEMLTEASDGRAALQEMMCLHVDMATRRSAPFPPDRQAAIAALAAAHARLPQPPGLGRRIAAIGPAAAKP